MPKLVSRQGAVLFAIILGSLAFAILNELVGSSRGASRQTITVRVTNEGLPVSGLPLRLMDSGPDCAPDPRSFYRTGSTDAAGFESWSRPIKRKNPSRRGAARELFDFREPRTERVRICANLGNWDGAIFVGDVGQYERRLNVTCDLALETTEKCYGTSPISLDRTVMVYVCVPCWVLLAIAIIRSRGRPVERDVAFAFATLIFAVLTGPLDRYWLLCQVLAVVASLGAIFALAHTLAANLEFRRSNQG